MMRWLWLLIIFAGCAVAEPSEQVSFQRSASQQAINYQYQWHDHNGIEQGIEFALDAMKVADLPRQQTSYRSRIAMRYVTSELLKHAKTIDPRKARITVKQMGDTVDIGFRSADNQYMQMLKSDMMNKKDMAFQQYLTDHYYHEFTSAYGQDAVKVDHTRYAQAYTKALIPASQAFYEKLGEGTDARDYLNLLLSWVQSIPYDELQDRAQSNGSGFNPPVALLDANVGDCDSKSVLAAAMIRAFLPNVPIRLVLLPEHALLGVAVSQIDSDFVLDDQGLQLVLMEPTGPAPLAFGDIADSSKQAIGRKLYVLESVP